MIFITVIKDIKECHSGVSPELSRNNETSNRTSRDITSASDESNSDEVPKMFKNPVLENNETNSESSVDEDSVKLGNILERYKNAYRLNPTGDIDSDLELDIVKNFDPIYEYLNEELSFLEVVLKKVQNYK
ncbi:hypothetical protein RF11_09400 [Thelohanellus kitauei]|uniref:Uncharacterized protein n=1 Tax=Thelohanellus kitauei TaxID=669202 RepID=A0A0C2MMI3_THEKT|nr:hypothetical protein RF11_09400 [Thelohanellus kitauei]